MILEGRVSTFSSVVQKVSKYSTGNSWLKFGRVPKLANIRCGRNTPASSSSFFKDFVLMHLVVTMVGWGTNTSLINLAHISLCTLAGYCPWQPAFAKSWSSGCVAPSKMACSASHLQVLAASFPWDHRLSNAVAKLLHFPFTRAFFSLPLFRAWSNFHPLSLFVIPVSRVLGGFPSCKGAGNFSTLWKRKLQLEPKLAWAKETATAKPKFKCQLFQNTKPQTQTSFKHPNQPMHKQHPPLFGTNYGSLCLKLTAQLQF